MRRGAVGASAMMFGLWGGLWFTGALRESGRWFTIQGLLRFGPDWWQNVFVERPGHHAYIQYAVPYFIFLVMIMGGAAMVWSGYRKTRGRSAS